MLQPKQVKPVFDKQASIIMKEVKEIQELLKMNAQKSHKDFSSVMIPGSQKMYGVKTPVLNDIAKKYKEGSFVLAEALWLSGFMEERIIAIKIMEKKGKDDPAKLLKLFQHYSASIDNWAVCDGLGMQFLRSIVKTHKKEIFTVAQKYNHSTNMWQRRLSLVMVEWYTRHSENHIIIKQLVKNLEGDEEYYVKKAVVWIKKNFTKGK
jgi:3-methyladenine DNA glycosylase AlkD